MELFSLEWWEGASYVITVIGLPFGIGVFLYEQQRERQNDEEEIYQYLSEEYAEFQKLVLKNSDLRLSSNTILVDISDEQYERKCILYDILVSLFERAYLLVYEDKMDKQTARMWASWEDYIRFWIRRADFRLLLPDLLDGEDADFVAYVKNLAQQENLVLETK
jgi:hypothetical protein